MGRGGTNAEEKVGFGFVFARKSVSKRLKRKLSKMMRTAASSTTTNMQKKEREREEERERVIVSANN